MDGLVEVDGTGALDVSATAEEVELLAMDLLVWGAAASTGCGGEGAGEFSGSGEGSGRFVGLAKLEARRDVLTIFGRGLVFFAGGSSDCSRGCRLYC